jgi:predicted N-acyltransferase
MPLVSNPQITIVARLADVDRAEWDSLVGPGESPFLEWDWLASLEEAGCAGAETGWIPQHLLVRQQGRLVAAAPMYLKSHSQGEFVFDHGWAEAAYKAGLDYYPKLLVAVPFTPANGRRLLTHPSLARAPLLRLLSGALRDLCLANNLSSVHVNFCEADAIAPLEEAGFLHRQGLQYHWQNRGYGAFSDYVNDLRSKRRNQVRRERREIAAAGVRVTVHEGIAIPDELFEPMFRIYRSTVDKMYWGRQYLNRRFFELLRDRFKRHLCFVVARRDREIVAGTVNVQKAGVFYGRYWGAFEEVRYLHFEVCYYAAIEHCIARGLTRFEPGAGGDFKYWRGFGPVVTHSMHFVAHPAFARAVADFLARERAYVDSVIDEMRARGPLKENT